MPALYVPIVLFLCSAGVLFVFILTRNKERMAMIERGLLPAEPARKHTGLKFGLVAIGVAIGILLGTILDTYTPIQEQAAYFSMIFLFGGLGFVAHHFILKNQPTEEN